MLSFTHQSKNNKNHQLDQLDFQPIIITNKLPKEVSPRKEQKLIIKTNNPNLHRTSSNSFKKNENNYHHPSKQFNPSKQQWAEGGKIQVFDRNLKKNQLAEQERRLRALKKTQKQQVFVELIENDKQIQNKAIKMQKQKDRQIEKLAQIVEDQKKQKIKNDKIYQQKLKQIERERREMIQLQRKIQKEGIKSGKQIKKQMQMLYKNEIPSNDRAKCHQEIRPIKEKPSELTQSEVAIEQKNTLRQHQLEHLFNQREKCLKELPSLSYSPTLIPLLSRASYKIISTHISTLVELFIDDLLQEQVYLMEGIELQENLEKTKNKEKQIMQDYYQQLEDFVDEAEEIQHRVGRYQTMKFEDVYLPKHYAKYQPKGSQFKYDETTEIKQLHLHFNEEVIQEIESRKDRFVRFVSSFDQYKKSNLVMFEKTTEEIIDEAIEKLAKQLDKGSGDFVDLVFRNQFK